MNLTVYIGPYIDVIPTKEISTRRVNGCPQCKKEGNWRFCSWCGSPLGQIVLEVESYSFDENKWMAAIRKEGLEEEDFHDISQKESRVWLALNNDPSLGKWLAIDKSYGILTEDRINSDDAMETFRNRYAKYIEILKSLHGEDNVSTKWGIIYYVV